MQMEFIFKIYVTLLVIILFWCQLLSSKSRSVFLNPFLKNDFPLMTLFRYFFLILDPMTFTDTLYNYNLVTLWKAKKEKEKTLL